jgi:hypothetical protein
MPRQIDQRERLALVQMVEDAGLVGTQQPACPGITDMPRVTGKVDAGIKLHQLSRGIARHTQKKLRPNSLICQIKLNQIITATPADRNFPLLLRKPLK